jgi:hypothetical protein
MPFLRFALARTLVSRTIMRRHANPQSGGLASEGTGWEIELNSAERINDRRNTISDVTDRDEWLLQLGGENLPCFLLYRAPVPSSSELEPLL